MAKKDNIKDEYGKARRALKRAYKSAGRVGYDVSGVQMPAIPKKITAGSVRKLKAIKANIRFKLDVIDIETGKRYKAGSYEARGVVVKNKKKISESKKAKKRASTSTSTSTSTLTSTPAPSASVDPEDVQVVTEFLEYLKNNIYIEGSGGKFKGEGWGYAYNLVIGAIQDYGYSAVRAGVEAYGYDIESYEDSDILSVAGAREWFFTFMKYVGYNDKAVNDMLDNAGEKFVEVSEYEELPFD